MEKRYKMRDAKYENTMSNEFLMPNERIPEVYRNYHQWDSIIKKGRIEASPSALEHPPFKYKDRILKRASAASSYSSGTDSSEGYSLPEKYATDTMTFHKLEPCFEASNSSTFMKVPEYAKEASVKEIQESEKDGISMSNEFLMPDERIPEVYRNYHQWDSIIKKGTIEASPIVLEHPPFKYKDRKLKLRASPVASYSSGTDTAECYSPPEKYATMTFHNLVPCFEASNSSIVTKVREDSEEVSVKEIQDSEKDGISSMTNLGFFKRIEPLYNDLSEGSCTENELDHSTLFKQLKSSFDQIVPFVDDLSNVLGSIPAVLSSTYEPVRGLVEVGKASSGKYRICQPSFEKAVSKYSIKDAVVALVECDTFLTRKETLESTIGRSSSSRSGKQLKPLDPAKLAALYHILADKNRMPNIQRTQDCLNSSPDFLTVIEQKMVREALSQYFNQQRQRQKKNRCKPDHICTSSKESAKY